MLWASGRMGFGGSTTALAVHAEVMPTHIASLPVAVNLQCHSARHKEAVLNELIHNRRSKIR